MTVQEQIAQDVAMVTQHAGLQSRLLNFLQILKSSVPKQANGNKVLAHAGTIGNDEALELSQFIKDEFSKLDNEWH